MSTFYGLQAQNRLMKSAVGPGNVHEGKRPLLELLACLYNALQMVALLVCKLVGSDEPSIL